MRYLKFILFSVYIILTILLLLLNFNRCSRVISSTPTVSEDTVARGDVVEVAEKIGGRGKLKVTLLWDFHADIDLHVKQPNGEKIYFQRKVDPITGGALDVDNQSGGYGSAENIFWENPPSGEYEVIVKYYKGSNSGFESGDCQVIVFNGNASPQRYTIRMTEKGQVEQVTKIVI